MWTFERTFTHGAGYSVYSLLWLSGVSRFPASALRCYRPVCCAARGARPFVSEIKSVGDSSEHSHSQIPHTGGRPRTRDMTTINILLALLFYSPSPIATRFHFLATFLPRVLHVSSWRRSLFFLHHFMLIRVQLEHAWQELCLSVLLEDTRCKLSAPFPWKKERAATRGSAHFSCLPSNLPTRLIRPFSHSFILFFSHPTSLPLQPLFQFQCTPLYSTMNNNNNNNNNTQVVADQVRESFKDPRKTRHLPDVSWRRSPGQLEAQGSVPLQWLPIQEGQGSAIVLPGHPIWIQADSNPRNYGNQRSYQFL